MSEEINTKAPEIIPESPKDVTQVQTLQQIATSQGQKMPKEMSPEQFRTQLLLSHQYGVLSVVPAFKKLSVHAKDRVFTALMQLPVADIPVFLKKKDEREVYLGSQKLMMERAAIVFNRAKQEADAEKKAIAETEEKRLKDIKLTDNVSVEGANQEEVIKI